VDDLAVAATVILGVLAVAGALVISRLWPRSLTVTRS
jgi:hypothetical protein